MPNIKQHLSKLDDIVDNVFIPAITEGHVCSTDERLLLFLPVKKGRLALERLRYPGFGVRVRVVSSCFTDVCNTIILFLFSCNRQ
jgi:hypothetical protein